MEINDVVVEPHCWYCHAEQSETLGSDVLPSAGDLSVCGYCGMVSVFIGCGLRARRPTSAEHLAAKREPSVLAYQHAVDAKRGRPVWIAGRVFIVGVERRA